ncbi:MAG: hypothetical protein GY793_02870 [Proteobacteria bacterium]|nr:hypothetical protein [Pseudomonadota bacterium]
MKDQTSSKKPTPSASNATNGYTCAVEELRKMRGDAKRNQYEALAKKDYDHKRWYSFLEGIDVAIHRLEMKNE